jgi:hypothetical protein
MFLHENPVATVHTTSDATSQIDSRRDVRFLSLANSDVASEGQDVVVSQEDVALVDGSDSPQNSERDTKRGHTEGRRRLKRGNTLFNNILATSFRKAIMTDIAPTNDFWDEFVRQHALAGLLLSVQLNYPRTQRLLVLFCIIIGKFWVLGAFLAPNSYEDDEPEGFNAIKSIGIREILVIVFSFLITKPFYVLLMKLFFHDRVYIKLSNDPARKRKMKCRILAGYIVSISWLTFCYFSSIIISMILFEASYNKTAVWIMCFWLQITIYI